jgi:hypothetical protein
VHGLSSLRSERPGRLDSQVRFTRIPPLPGGGISIGSCRGLVWEILFWPDLGGPKIYLLSSSADTQNTICPPIGLRIGLRGQFSV